MKLFKPDANGNPNGFATLIAVLLTITLGGLLLWGALKHDSGSIFFVFFLFYIFLFDFVLGCFEALLCPNHIPKLMRPIIKPKEPSPFLDLIGKTDNQL